MDAADNALRPLRGASRTRLPGWCAVAEPIVRSVSYCLARRYWLQPCERQDLEQELWLELLVRHSGRDRAGNYQSLSGQDAQAFRLGVGSQLRVEVQRIGAAMTRSWPFWRRLRPMPERLLFDRTADQLIGGETEHSPHRRELSLDVFAILAELPAAQRSLCEALMNGLAIPASYSAEQGHHLAALRARLAALNLHESQ